MLIVISDGGDNASTHYNLKQIVPLAIESNAVIYTIGLFDESDSDRNPGVLKQLAHTTGGEFFQQEKIAEVVPLCARIARHSQPVHHRVYADESPADGRFRAIQVKVKAPGQERLTVRTRPGYYAPTAPTGTPSKSNEPKSATPGKLKPLAFALTYSTDFWMCDESLLLGNQL